MNFEKIISKIIGVILIIILVKIAFGILFSADEYMQKRFEERAKRPITQDVKNQTTPLEKR